MQGLSRSPQEGGPELKTLEQKSGFEKLLDKVGAKIKSLYTGNVQKNQGSEINKPKEAQASGKTQTPSDRGTLNENQHSAINTLGGESILSNVTRGLGALKKTLQENLSSKNKSADGNGGNTNASDSSLAVAGRNRSAQATPEQVVNNIKNNGDDSQFANLTSSQKKEVMESLLKDFISPQGRQDPNIKAALLNPSTGVGKVFVALCEKKWIGAEYAFCRDWTKFMNEPTNGELLQKIQKEHLSNNTNLTAVEQQKLGALDTQKIDNEAVNELDKLFNGRNNNAITFFKAAINEQLPTLTDVDFK